VLKIYTQQKLLVEGCSWSSCSTGPELKGTCGPQFTVRSCTGTAATSSNNLLGGNMNGNPAFSGEICFNLLHDSTAALRLNQDNLCEEIYVYRNTLIGTVTVDLATGTGPFTFSHNVIQNAQGANEIPYVSAGDAESDETVVVMHDNLTGASGLVTAAGLLVDRNLVGTYGHELSAASPWVMIY
jgi:hypothetical protein